MRPEDLAFSPTSLAEDGPVRVRWLGTAGFSLTSGDTVVLFDPYVTRASLGRCLLAPLWSDPLAVATYAPKADAIVVGHTHFDHALDVPLIAQRTGAEVFGSRSAVRLCRASGVREAQLHDVERAPGQAPVEAEVGPFTLRFHPSAHARFLLGRVPFPGDITDCDDIPLRTEGYRCGAVFAVEIRVAGRTLFHLGSAELVASSAPRLEADLVMFCVAGWTTTPGLVPKVLRALRPRAVLLSHWDDFLRPMERGARALPALAMPRLVDAFTRETKDVRVGTLPLLGELGV